MTVTVETALDRALGRIPDVVFERSGRRWTHAFSADVWWRLTVERDEGWSSTRGLVHVGVVVPAAIELLQGTDMFPVKVSPGNVSEYLCLLMGQPRPPLTPWRCWSRICPGSRSPGCGLTVT